MSFAKLTASTLAIAAVSATAAAARDNVQVAGSSTVLPYASIVAEAFGEMDDDSSGQVDIDQFSAWWTVQKANRGADIEARMQVAQAQMKRLKGSLGTGVMKISAVAPEHRVVEARARVFHARKALPWPSRRQKRAR